MAKKIFTSESFASFINEIKSYVTNAISTKADSSHYHSISDVSNLQNTLNAKATQNSLDSHTSDTTKHITSTERTSWNSAKTHADSAHAPSNAQANQNAFSNIKVGDTTISADTTTDTLTLVGSNVTITPDATNDKVTIAVASGSTSAKGIVQLTNSTSSTSTTTAATPNSVKSAYDLANTAKTNAATAQSKADSAYSLAESKVDSLSDLGITATATELNYMDGVTSNVQTQLDGKSGTGHTHNYAGSSSAGGSANSAVKLTTSAGSATKPVYFSDGKPVACTYELKKTVPSDAVFTDTKYTHPTTSGNKHIPSGGSNGQILRWSADGTAVWGNDKAIYKKNLITLPTTGWVGDNPPYSIDLSITGVLENSDVQITPMLEMTLEQLDAWENLRLYAGKTYDGYITLKANGFKPNVEIPLEVLIGSEIIE